MTKHVNAFTASFSVHLLVLASLIWCSAAAVRESARTVAATTPAMALAPTLQLPRSRDDTKSTRATASSAPVHLFIPNETGSIEVRMPNFSFDFGKVKRRAASLFPFLTNDLALDPIRQLAAPSEHKGLINPYALGSADAGKPPLSIKWRCGIGHSQM